jgi:hypothetical protein
MLKDLIKIADTLDSLGLIKEASAIDSLIRKISSEYTFDDFLKRHEKSREEYDSEEDFMKEELQKLYHEEKRGMEYMASGMSKEEAKDRTREILKETSKIADLREHHRRILFEKPYRDLYYNLSDNEPTPEGMLEWHKEKIKEFDDLAEELRTEERGLIFFIRDGGW